MSALTPRIRPRLPWWLAPVATLVLAMSLSWFTVPAPRQWELAWMRDWQRTEASRVRRRAFAVRDSANVFHEAYVLTDARARAQAEPPTAGGLAIRADRDVPADVVRTFTEAVQQEAAALTDSVRTPVIVRVLVDATTRSSSYEQAVVMPAVAGEPCVAQVRLAPKHLNQTTIRSQVLGICGFYAKFGPAGKGMTAWLTRTQMRTAIVHTSAEFGPPFGGRNLRMAGYYQPVVTACQIGRLDQCRRFMEGDEYIALYWQPYVQDRLLTARQLTSATRVRTYQAFPYSQPTNTGSRLAALRATLGDERFAILWRDDDEPGPAFAAREGVPLEHMVSRGLRGDGRPYRPGNQMHGGALLVVLALIGGFAVVILLRTPRRYVA